MQDDIAKYDPSEARDPRGRWTRTRTAAAVARRSARIVAHAAAVHYAVVAAVNAPTLAAAMPHAALRHGRELQRLARQPLTDEAARQLLLAREGLERLQVRVTRAGPPA